MGPVQETPSDFFVAISKLIENPSLRTEFGKNGYERVIKEFSIEKHVKEFEAVFKNFQDNF